MDNVSNQIPTIQIEPERADTDGEAAAMLMEAYGFKLDKFQELIINAWLGKDQAGEYNVISAGLSTPRQCGKTEVLIARCFYELLVNAGRILWTSHQVRSVKKVFGRLVAMFTDKKHPEIIERVKKIRYGIGEESIELKNGGVIEFSSRSRQTARGFDGISLIILDEAQEITEEILAALLAILSSSKTGSRQIIYAGTPPYIGCHGEVFKKFRQACIEENERGRICERCWHEWGISGNLSEINLDDESLWIRVNPPLGKRLSLEFTRNERKSLNDLAFAQERLGFWPPPAQEEAAEFFISPELWESCKSQDQKPQGKTAYGVKFSADGSEVVLCGAVIPKEGKARITMIERQPTGLGLNWLADWLIKRNKIGCCVVIDGKNGPDVLINKIVTYWPFKGCIIKPSAGQVVAAAQMLINDLIEQNVTWFEGQEELTESAISSTKRNIGNIGQSFGGPNSAPIEACSLALWGCRTSKRDPQKIMRIG